MTTRIRGAISAYQAAWFEYREKFVADQLTTHPEPKFPDYALAHGCIFVKAIPHLIWYDDYSDFLKSQFGREYYRWYIEFGGVWFDNGADAELFRFYCG